MKHMFKITLFAFASIMTQSLLFAGNGVCFHCEEIREYNRLHPQTYEYYEDYLKEQQQQKQPAANTDLPAADQKPQQQEHPNTNSKIQVLYLL